MFKPYPLQLFLFLWHLTVQQHAKSRTKDARMYLQLRHIYTRHPYLLEMRIDALEFTTMQISIELYVLYLSVLFSWL